MCANINSGPGDLASRHQTNSLLRIECQSRAAYEIIKRSAQHLVNKFQRRKNLAGLRRHTGLAVSCLYIDWVIKVTKRASTSRKFPPQRWPRRAQRSILNTCRASIASIGIFFLRSRVFCRPNAVQKGFSCLRLTTFGVCCFVAAAE